MTELTREQVEAAHLNVAISEIGEAIKLLGRYLQQGPQDHNEVTKGDIAIGLRKAAHRIEHGSLDTWLTEVKT